jgi:hypothetical protein
METPQTSPAPEHVPADRTTRILRLVVGGLVGLLVLAAGLVGVAYALTPEPIRHPVASHYHFRLQMLVNGTAVNFGGTAFQTPLNHDLCSAKLTTEPIHFHDGLDQFVHVHWAGMTGGLFLKNYGWDLAGGLPGLLGVRFDQVPRLVPVAVHGTALPAAVEGDRYYVYVGNAAGYQERPWNDFLHQDLERFFTGRAAAVSGPWSGLVPAASAQGDEAQLTQLNHVVGSAVIFAQRDKPTDAQIKDRFAHLVPLPESSCGG